MSRPPDDVSAADLFQKLMEAPRPTELIDFPRRQANGEPFGKIRLQVLDGDEIDRARKITYRKLKDEQFTNDDLRSATMAEVVGDGVAREVVAMAALSEKGPLDDNGVPMYGRIFKDADDLKKLRPAEVHILFNAYQLTQHKYGPYEKTVTSEADLNAWVKRLEEGGSEFPLLQQSLPALVELAFLLARRTYLLSAILESQWASLPASFKSRLEAFSMGTGYYTERPATSSPAGGESSADELAGALKDAQERLRKLEELAAAEHVARMAEPVTTAQATRMAKIQEES